MKKRTWEEFQTYIRDNGLEGQFSQHDLALAELEPEAGFGIAAAKLGYANAESAEEKAAYNAAAERIRSWSGGYLGGRDGSGYTQTTDPEAESRRQQRQRLAGEVTQKADALQQAEQRVRDSGTEYVGERNRLLQAAKNLSFSYDPDQDPVWQSYVKQYTRAGKRAGENALGSAAAATGGVPSSYAVTAAAQAEGEYASRLSEELPELYRDAYDRYSTEKKDLLELAEQYDNAAQREYEIASKERTQARSAYEDALENYLQQTETDADWEEEQELDYRDWLERFLATAG